MPGLRWTSEEDDRLHELVKTGTVQQVSDAMGRSIPGVRERCKKHGLLIVHRVAGGPHRGKVLKHWTQADKLELLGLAGKGTIRRAAKKIGRTEEAVKCMLQRLGIKWRQGLVSETSAADMLELQRWEVQRLRARYKIPCQRRSNVVHYSDANLERLMDAAETEFGSGWTRPTWEM